MHRSWFFILCLLIPYLTFSQIKITHTIQQKIINSSGDNIMNYTISYKTPKEKFEFDSIETIADSVQIENTSILMNPCCSLLFSFYMNIPNCKVCHESGHTLYNTTQGILLYYRYGGKNYVAPIKKFKRLKDIHKN